MLEIKKQGVGENKQSLVGMVKVEGERKFSKSLLEPVSGIISQVESIKIPKLNQEGKKRNKKEH